MSYPTFEIWKTREANSENVEKCVLIPCGFREIQVGEIVNHHDTIHHDKSPWYNIYAEIQGFTLDLFVLA